MTDAGIKENMVKVQELIKQAPGNAGSGSDGSAESALGAQAEHMSSAQTARNDFIFPIMTFIGCKSTDIYQHNVENQCREGLYNSARA